LSTNVISYSICPKVHLQISNIRSKANNNESFRQGSTFRKFLRTSDKVTKLQRNKTWTTTTYRSSSTVHSPHISTVNTPLAQSGTLKKINSSYSSWNVFQFQNYI